MQSENAKVGIIRSKLCHNVIRKCIVNTFVSQLTSSWLYDVTSADVHKTNAVLSMYCDSDKAVQSDYLYKKIKHVQQIICTQ